MTQRIVLTGGPGAGKSTVLGLLRDLGYDIGADAARSIIMERKAAGLSPRPDPQTFARKILERELATYQSAGEKHMFCERGIIDVAGSLLASGAFDEEAAMKLIADHPYDHAFLFPAWAKIYQTDAERDHSFDHACQVYESTRDWYRRVGCSFIEVPTASPRERVQFILNCVQQ